MKMNVRPSPASVPMVAASTPWEASSVIAMRVSIPASPSLSAMVSVTRNKQGEQRLVRSGTGMRSGTPRRQCRELLYHYQYRCMSLHTLCRRADSSLSPPSSYSFPSTSMTPVTLEASSQNDLSLGFPQQPKN